MNDADLSMSEADLQQTIIEAAEAYGWLWHHETDARRSNAGWPDLEIIGGHRLLRLECKSEKGRVRPEQKLVLDAYAQVDTVTSGVIRPSDLDRVIFTLRHGKNRRPRR